jgi:hypothetical protein
LNPQTVSNLRGQYRSLLEAFTVAAETLRQIASQFTSEMMVEEITSVHHLSQLQQIGVDLRGKEGSSQSVSQELNESSKSIVELCRSYGIMLPAEDVPTLATALDSLKMLDQVSQAGLIQLISEYIAAPPEDHAKGAFHDRVADFLQTLQTRKQNDALNDSKYSENDAVGKMLGQVSPPDISLLIHSDPTNREACAADLALLDSVTRETAWALDNAWSVLRHVHMHMAAQAASGILTRIAAQRELEKVTREAQEFSALLTKLESALGLEKTRGTTLDRLKAIIAVVTGDSAEVPGQVQGKAIVLNRLAVRRIMETVDDMDAAQRRRVCPPCLIQ